MPRWVPSSLAVNATKPAFQVCTRTLTDTPKEILYAAADAERISEYILTIERKKEIRHTQEVGTMKKDIPHSGADVPGCSLR